MYLGEHQPMCNAKIIHSISTIHILQTIISKSHFYILFPTFLFKFKINSLLLDEMRDGVLPPLLPSLTARMTSYQAR